MTSSTSYQQQHRPSIDLAAAPQTRPSWPTNFHQQQTTTHHWVACLLLLPATRSDGPAAAERHSVTPLFVFIFTEVRFQHPKAQPCALWDLAASSFDHSGTACVQRSSNRKRALIPRCSCVAFACCALHYLRGTAIKSGTDHADWRMALRAMRMHDTLRSPNCLCPCSRLSTCMHGCIIGPGWPLP